MIPKHAASNYGFGTPDPTAPTAPTVTETTTQTAARKSLQEYGFEIGSIEERYQAAAQHRDELRATRRRHQDKPKESEAWGEIPESPELDIGV